MFPETASSEFQPLSGRHRSSGSTVSMSPSARPSSKTSAARRKLLENLKTCPIKELIFIAPWLGYVEEAKEFVLDKDKQKIPLLDAKKNIIPGKFLMRNIGSPQYRGAEAKLGKAADDYLAKVLEGLAGFLVDKKQALTGTDGKPRSAFTIKNLILACHSGGGVA